MFSYSRMTLPQTTMNFLLDKDVHFLKFDLKFVISAKSVKTDYPANETRNK